MLLVYTHPNQHSLASCPLLTWLVLSTKLWREDPLDSGEVGILRCLQVPWAARRCHHWPDQRGAERAKRRREGIPVEAETWRQIQETVQEPGLEAHVLQALT